MKIGFGLGMTTSQAPTGGITIQYVDRPCLDAEDPDWEYVTDAVAAPGGDASTFTAPADDSIEYYLGNFDPQLPAEAKVLGFELTVRAKLSAVVPHSLYLKSGNDNFSQNYILEEKTDLTTEYQDLVFGGPMEMWNGDQPPNMDIINPEYEFWFYLGLENQDPVDDTDLSIDHVSLRIYYTLDNYTYTHLTTSQARTGTVIQSVYEPTEDITAEVTTAEDSNTSTFTVPAPQGGNPYWQDYLVMDNWGFSLPAGAQIKGIKYTFRAKLNAVYSHELWLYAVPEENDFYETPEPLALVSLYAASNPLTTSFQTFTWGGPRSILGIDKVNLPLDIDAINEAVGKKFKLQLGIRNKDANNDLEFVVDYSNLEIFYNE